MRALNNKFTLVVSSVLLLAIIQSDCYQRGFKPFGELGRALAQTRANISSSAPDVQLKIQVKEQRYCHSSIPNHNVIQLILSVDFVNIGKDRLIFFKSGHRIVECMLSRTQDDALAKQYESHDWLHGTNQFLDDITSLIDTPAPSNDFFIVVSPGELYRSEERLSIPIEVNEGTQQPNNLPEGEHFLQVTLVTWPDVDTQPANLRERWKVYGYLYSKAVTSAPVSFTFFPYTNTERCSRYQWFAGSITEQK